MTRLQPQPAVVAPEKSSRPAPPPPATGARRDRGVTILKGLAIIGVVGHHLRHPQFSPATSAGVDEVVRWCSWSVYVFVAAAGFLHARSVAHASSSLAAFIRHRAQRLLLPWIALIVANAAIWQLLESTGLIRPGGLPPGLFAKLTGAFASLGTLVGVQLYFLPVLFLLSLVAALVFAAGGRRAVGALGLAALAVGLAAFPHSDHAGYGAGTLFWYFVQYCAGFLLFNASPRRNALWLAVAAAVALAAFVGLPDSGKAAALLLLLFRGPISRLFPLWFDRVGEASGTIFAWHFPFVLLLALAPLPRLHLGALEFPAALLAGLAVVAGGTVVHTGLARTRWRRILF